MVTINNKIKATNFLKISIDGTFNEKDVSKLLPLMLDVRDDELNLMVVIEKLDIRGSLSALDEKLKAEIMFLKKVRKCAFVTDKRWMRYLVQVEQFLLPSIEIKTFETDEQEQAKKWVTN